MQEKTVQASTCKLPVKFAIAIAVIKSNRMPGILCMDADLMRSTRYRTGFDQRRELIPLFNLEAGLRWFPFSIYANDTLTALQNILQQRRLNDFTVRLPLAAYQREIVFLHAFHTQLLMERTQCRPFFGDQKHAGSIPIQTMDQFKETRFRTQRT